MLAHVLALIVWLEPIDITCDRCCPDHRSYPRSLVDSDLPALLALPCLKLWRGTPNLPEPDVPPAQHKARFAFPGARSPRQMLYYENASKSRVPLSTRKLNVNVKLDPLGHRYLACHM